MTKNVGIANSLFMYVPRLTWANYQREWGQWAAYYTSPPSFIKTFFIRWLNNLRDC